MSDDNSALDEKDTEWKIALAKFAKSCSNEEFTGLYLELKRVFTLKEAIELLQRINDYLEGFELAARLAKDNKHHDLIMGILDEACQLLLLLNVTKRQRLTLWA